jgi:hypothetical protein
MNPVRSGTDLLGARYHEILGYRVEGLKKYGGRVTSDMYGPRSMMTLPTITLGPPQTPSVKMGPLFFGDNPPALALLRRHIAQYPRPITIVEIGPGKGSAAKALRHAFKERIEAYYGIDRDRTAEGPYDRIDSVADLRGAVDLIIASHVVEHMTPDEFFEGILRPLTAKLSGDGSIVVATPNALAPASIFGDFTHVQGYAWYDLYAILRLFFESVDVTRARYIWSPARVASLLPRILATRALELDWCDEILCVARRPKRDLPAAAE